jgi:ABC-type transporter Mla MlaB component
MTRYPNILEEDLNGDFYLDLAGPLNVTTAECAISEIKAIFADGHSTLSLGIDAIENIDSEIIGFLYVLTSTFNNKSKNITLRCTNRNTLQLLAICGHIEPLRIDTKKPAKTAHIVYLNS